MINAKTGHSFPLVSLLAPANHHDSQFLFLLVKLAQSMGIEMKLITADDAYHDNNGSFFEQTGVHLTKPPTSKTVAPDHVDVKTKSVFLDDMCEVPMQHVGYEGQAHEYKCGADSGECPRSQSCPQCRFIPFDSGYFQRISDMDHQVDPAHDIRKNSERPFNLLKNQTGLEKVRVRSQHGLLTRSVFSNIGTLLLEMAGTRKKKIVVKQRQDTLFEVAA